MRELIILVIVFSIFALSCEELYKAELDTEVGIMVVEGAMNADEEIHRLKLYNTLGFYDGILYPGISGADAYIIDDQNITIPFIEDDTGSYLLNYKFNSEHKYKLRIEYEGNIYESTFQSVPPKPEIDTTYGRFEKMYFKPAWSNSTEDVNAERIVQVYTSLCDNENFNYFRFSGRKIIQFDVIGFTGVIHVWDTYNLDQLTINLAGSNEFYDINQFEIHPLDFFRGQWKYLGYHSGIIFLGWIYIVDAYGITEESYRYFSEMNEQIGSEGKIYDPVYVQPQSNISCLNDGDIEVLGNFMIQSHTEYRYYIMYYSTGDYLIVKKIPYFYEIPESGAEIEKPEFWESSLKNYPELNN